MFFKGRVLKNTKALIVHLLGSSIQFFAKAYMASFQFSDFQLKSFMDPKPADL